MNPQSAAIAGSGNPLKSRFESEIRAKIFSKSADPFAYSPASLYKLQIRTVLKDTMNCAAILENIIWPRLGRQFHLPSKFTCLFARILRQIIGWRNRMAWETRSPLEKLSPWVYLPITTCFGSIEKRAKRGSHSLLERTRSRPGLIQLPLQELSCQWFHISLHRYSEWFVSTSLTLETFVLRCSTVPFPANRR